MTCKPFLRPKKVLAALDRDAVGVGGAGIANAMLKEPGKVVPTGDAVQVADNLEADVPPGVCWSSELALDALRRLGHMREQGALAVFGHELSQLNDLRVAPEYYD